VSFSVNPAALAGLADRLDRMGRDLEAGRAYLRRHTRLSSGLGLLNLVLGGHERVVSGVDGYLRTMAATCDAGYAVRLRRALASYRRSDRASSARFDAGLPALASAPRHAGRDPGLRALGSLSGGPGTGVPEPAPGVGPPPGPEIFADPISLLDRLVPPPDHHDRFPHQPRWYDVVSPSSTGRDMVWRATGMAARIGLLDRPVDPYEKLLVPVCGDWAGLYGCGDVLDALAGALDDGDLALRRAAGAIPVVWSGNAADGCALALRHLAADMAAGAAALRAIAETYRRAAQGAHDTFEAVGTAVTLLVDEAITGGVTIESAGLLAPAMAATQMRNVAVLALRAVHLLAAAAEAARAGGAALDAAGLGFGSISPTQPLPATPESPLPALPAPATHVPR
jgi:hypothetical protein